MTDQTLYDRDIVAWAEEQAAALRRLARDHPETSNAVDWENVIEEIESVGRAQRHGVESKISQIFIHLMKIASDPQAASGAHWRSEVATWQAVLRRRFTPSMKHAIDLEDLWQEARRLADGALFEWGARLSRAIPIACPFSFADLIAKDFDVEQALKRCAGDR